MAALADNPIVERIFRCSCGEEIGVCKWPARSVEDGRDLGPSYLELSDDNPSGTATLWREGTGDAGFYDQRCPSCDARLVPPPDQPALF